MDADFPGLLPCPNHFPVRSSKKVREKRHVQVAAVPTSSLVLAYIGCLSCSGPIPGNCGLRAARLVDARDNHHPVEEKVQSVAPLVETLKRGTLT